MKRLLVIVDMQNDFVSGALGSEAAKSVVPAVKSLIEKEKSSNAEIVFTLDTHGENYLSTQEGRLLPVVHTIEGTDGWNLIPELSKYANGAKTFRKGTFGSLSLAEYARAGDYDEIALCGVCTDICVISNALLLKAYCPETTVRVIASACAGTSEKNHAAALTAMESCQVVIE